MAAYFLLSNFISNIEIIFFVAAAYVFVMKHS